MPIIKADEFEMLFIKKRYIYKSFDLEETFNLLLKYKIYFVHTFLLINDNNHHTIEDLLKNLNWDNR